MLPRLGLILLALLLLLPASASAAPRVQHLHFKYGPVTIQPGQNTISIDGDKIPRPKVSGWIVGFRPNLERPGGSVPRVDVIHLHHAVWLINGRPTFAAGEEKTRVKLPRGFGWRYSPDDKWLLNHMIHNLLPNRDKVYITYDIDFVPDSSPAAKKIHKVKTLWLDVEGGKAYPVFDVHRGSGATGASRTPTTSPARTAAGRRATRRSSRATACWSGRPGTSTPAASTPTSSSRAAGARSTCSARRRTTGSRPARCRGTWR